MGESSSIFPFSRKSSNFLCFLPESSLDPGTELSISEEFCAVGQHRNDGVTPGDVARVILTDDGNADISLSQSINCFENHLCAKVDALGQVHCDASSIFL